MTTNWHDPWVNNVTYYEAANMNVPLGQLDEWITALALGIYDIGGSFENLPVSSEVILRFPIPRTILFPSSLAYSQMTAGIAASLETTLSIRKNNAEFGTAVFEASATSATFTGLQTQFDAGDVLTIVCPPTPDATLANIGWALTATRIVIAPE